MFIVIIFLVSLHYNFTKRRKVSEVLNIETDVRIGGDEEPEMQSVKN